jgi:hypothetical protein
MLKGDKMVKRVFEVKVYYGHNDTTDYPSHDTTYTVVAKDDVGARNTALTMFNDDFKTSVTLVHYCNINKICTLDE